MERLGWPPVTDEPALARIETAITIARPVETVFAFATHAAQWHRWHPATAAVSNVADRPLLEGDEVTESIRAGGKRFTATWTVIACESPRLWVIATRTDEGESRIAYRLAAQDGGCRFQRILEFRSLKWPWSMFDTTLTRWVLTRQSARALDNLKSVLETGRKQ